MRRFQTLNEAKSWFAANAAAPASVVIISVDETDLILTFPTLRVINGRVIATGAVPKRDSAATKLRRDTLVFPCMTKRR